MHSGHLVKASKLTMSWVYVVICLAVILGGCGAPKPPLSEKAQAFKKELLGEIQKLTPQLIEPVSKQDWEAVKPILQASYETMQKAGKLAPLIVVLMDQNGIIQERVPPTKESHFDFSNYAPVKTMFAEKRKVQATPYLKGTKIYVILAPLLKENDVAGALGMVFLESELEKWKVSEKEFLDINFNE